MVVLDVIFIILGILMFISFKRSKLEVSKWLFEEGFFRYMFKSIFLVVSIVILLVRVDWSFLLIKLF